MRAVKLGEREVSLTRPADIGDRIAVATGLSLREMAAAVRSGSVPMLTTAMLALMGDDKPARAELAVEVANPEIDQRELGSALADILLDEPAPADPTPAPAPAPALAPTPQEPPHGE